MEVAGERRLPAPRERVWRALRDPATLKRCIPGCDELEMSSDRELRARIRADAAAAGRLSVALSFSDIDPPRGFRVRGRPAEGGGGEGEAEVRLIDEGSGGTLVRYAGRLRAAGAADMGAYLAHFLDRLAAVVGDEMAAAPAPAAVAEPTDGVTAGPPADPEYPPEPATGLPPWLWVTGMIVGLVLLLLIFG